MDSYVRVIYCSEHTKTCHIFTGCLFLLCHFRYNRGCTSLREEDSATLISEALKKKFILKDEDTAAVKRK